MSLWWMLAVAGSVEAHAHEVVGCKIGAMSAKERTEHEADTERVLGAVTRVDPLAGGLSLSLPAGQDTSSLLEKWVSVERRCCDFLTWTVRPDGGELHVDVVGSDDGLAVVRSLLVAPLAERHVPGA